MENATNATLFPTDPAAIFTGIKDALGITFLTKTIQCSRTHAYRLCASSKTNEETRKNPLHIIEIIVKELMDRGYKSIAVALVDRLAKIVGGELSFRNAKPDKDSFLAETLDVNSATSQFHIKAQKHLAHGSFSEEEVRAAKKDAHQQIDEAYAAFKIQKKEVIPNANPLHSPDRP